MLREIFTGIKPNKKTDQEADEEADEKAHESETSEESAEQRKNYQRGGLKILSPYQLLIRLPITLAQLKAGNNAEKLKNEIRQQLNYLHPSKKLRERIYNQLINTI